MSQRRRSRFCYAWLRKGHPRPEWVFASVSGTVLDESNVRKALNRILNAADLHRRGPHQMRHMFASLLLQDGVPITYVSRQLGHKDASITLRVCALVARCVEGKTRQSSRRHASIRIPGAPERL